ncbi:helix-hairpin-helix domain-containing protein [Halorubrum vacuolatum]|uniref:helix-hairpin-helix domain-containing protein n=1 Tax=Halorubrum vacuolatum TaxID=63740 RepID=UPI0037420839
MWTPRTRSAQVIRFPPSHRFGTDAPTSEIKPLTHPRVRSNSAYVTVVLLSRVVTTLGSLSEVTRQTIEDLFAEDLAYLSSRREPRRLRSHGVDAIDAVAAADHDELTRVTGIGKVRAQEIRRSAR